MSKYANAIQMTTPSQVLLPTFVLGFVAHLVRKYKFLKSIAFIVSPGVPYAAKATEREHQNCSNLVQELVSRLKTSTFERKCSARSVGMHLLFVFIRGGFCLL